jgi:hypothetical protein
MYNKPIFIAILMLIQLLDYSQSTCIKQAEITTATGNCEGCAFAGIMGGGFKTEDYPFYVG